MIKTGYTVRAGFPKHVMNNEKTVFKVGIKNKEKENEWFNVSFMCDYIDLENREEVEITEIVGFNVSEYEGKQQFTVYGSVRKPTEETHEHNQPIYEPKIEPTLDITEDDLPF